MTGTKHHPMKQPARPVYLRLMRRIGQENDDADATALELAALLRTAPCVERFDVVERHPKGGTRVSLDMNWLMLDAFIAYLEEHDWMSVM